jgi:O-antigen/teichoic acid export membrane protein
MLTDESPAGATSQKVARNGALYFLSLGLPALTALVMVPVTVRALGPARFGLLALAWAVAEGSGMFDLGLGRATVRFVADATGKGTARLRSIVLASVVSQTAAGLVAGLLLFALAPVLVDRVFDIAPDSEREAMAMFRVLALHLPVLLAAAALRASLEGAQRFDISAALRIPGAMAAVMVPALLAYLGYSLDVILWSLLAVRVFLLLASAVAVSRALHIGPWRPPDDWTILIEMLRYSGWVAVSTALGPLLGSFDRFVVGSVVGVAALGYYTGAAESANRFLLIPVTAFSALLPALAATNAVGGGGGGGAGARAPPPPRSGRVRQERARVGARSGSDPVQRARASRSLAVYPLSHSRSWERVARLGAPGEGRLFRSLCASAWLRPLPFATS